jgi:hypothetical protein
MEMLTGPARRFAAVVLAPVALTAVAGCGPTKITTESYPALNQHPVRRIVVMPFERLTTPQIQDPRGVVLEEPEGAKRSDISLGMAPPAGEPLRGIGLTVPRSVPGLVAHEVAQALGDLPGIMVFGPTEAERTIQSLADTGQGWSPERLAREVARKLHADAALLGKVLIYRERNGSRWGADPAAAGFEVRLMAPDGNVLWTGNYYEKQGSMNQDLIGFFQHGGGFVTADELLRYGAQKIAQKFPAAGR